MVILSIWYPRITRVYIYYHWVFQCLNFTLPLDGNDLRIQYCFVLLLQNYITFHFSFKLPCIAFLFTSIWVFLVVSKHIYLQPLSVNLFQALFHMVYGLVFITFIYLIFSLAGSYYVKAEIPRIGNEKLLNGLKEGVFVIDEDSQSVLFRNSSAKHLNKRLSTWKNFVSTSIDDSVDIFDRNTKQFSLFNKMILQANDLSHDYSATIK